MTFATLPQLNLDSLTFTVLPAGLSMLSDFSCIRISGEEAEDFLQGQFTNQLQGMAPGAVQLNAYCNPKGRTIAVFWLLKDDRAFQLLLPNDLADPLVKRLTLYKMRAKVTVDIIEDMTLVGAINTEVPSELVESGFSPYALDSKRSLLVGSGTNSDTVLNTCNLPLFGHDYWKLAQILSGEPQVYQSTSESLIPQHINLDLVNAVNFSKGCYPGQEIVARLRYLGKLKQRMIVGYVESADPLLPGTGIFSDDNKVGSVVDSVAVSNGQVASVNIKAIKIEQGEICLGDAGGPTLQRLTIPYRITVEKD